MMAKEITGVGETQQDGTVNVQMLYVFPISPRVVDGDGVDVVPVFDAAAIPGYFATQLDQSQLDLISTGDAGWIVRRLNKGLGESDADFVDRAKMDYDGIVAYSIQVERDRAVEADTFDRRRFQVNR